MSLNKKDQILSHAKITFFEQENIENVMSKYLNNRQQVDQTGLVEQINTLNNQMEKLLNRIQNIENILRF